MAINKFKIIFDKPGKTYFPRETVKARLVVVLDYPVKYQAINILIKGEANTFLTKSKHKKENKTTSAREEYFLRKSCVAGGTPDEEMNLDPGVHEYPFAFDLPENLPSSIETDFGNIKYTIKATIYHPWIFNPETTETFLVMSEYNLNKYPRVTRPFMEEKSKIFGGCCNSSRLVVNVLLPFRGYVSGQSIPVKVNIENEDEIGINNVKLSLEMIVTFHANNPRLRTKSDSLRVSEANKGPVKGNLVSYKQLLRVPPLLPSSLNNCSIIDVQYIFQLEVCVEGWFRKSLRMTIPIFIGTEPVVDYKTSTPGPMHISASKALSLDLLPPTYEESMKIGKTANHDAS